MPWAGAALTLLAHAFGLSDASPESVTAAIEKDPNADTKIKELEIQHESLWVTANAQDKENARAMAATNPANDRFLHVIAGVYLFGSLVYMGFQAANLIAKDQEIVSFLMNVSMMILSFYFGGMYKQRGQQAKI